MPIEPGVTYVFDLPYYSYEWWAELHALRCRFVSRLKKNSVMAVTTDRPVQAGADILSDSHEQPGTWVTVLTLRHG